MLQTVVARAFHSQSGTRMHCFTNWTRVAYVLAEHSRSAPQALGYLSSRWPPLLCERPSPSRHAGATQPPRPL
eukprot:5316947-Pleurochrysis_carterae.AAC.1